MPGSSSHSITDRCSECWPLVPTDDPVPIENLCDGLEFHPPGACHSLDPVPPGGGDAQVSQQSLKPAGGDQSLSPEGLHLVGIPVHLLTFLVTQGRVLLVVIVFIIYVVDLLLLLLLSGCALGCWPPRYYQLNLIGLHLPRCTQW
jgi:hypothetical protein